MIVLEILEGIERGRTYEFDTAAVTIGRGDSNAIVLPDFHLSGQHGELSSRNGALVYRDLRSTNGSAIRRNGDLVQVDKSHDWEIEIQDGDQMCLGDLKCPVVLTAHITGTSDEDKSEMLIASRSMSDLASVTDRVENDPASALRIYKALAPLSSRLELSAVLDTIITAIFNLITRATHCTVLLRSKDDPDRFLAAVARERASNGRHATQNDTIASFRPSQAVLRRVLKEGAAVLTANAQEEMSASDSIMAGRVLSVIAVPLWRGEQITGLIQIDNRSSAGVFTEQDLETAMLLASHGTLAVDNAKLVSRLRIAEDRLRGENSYLKQRATTPMKFDDIIGESPAMRALLTQLSKVVDTRATVAIVGETGTGKELIASAVHHNSPRAKHMFVAQNCAALPETLLESELFGHRKGSFTGADSDKKGLFDIADRGTLFLDEVGEMPMSLQAKLLRTLQEGTIRPVGQPTEKRVDVRIICATNRDLREEVNKGNFRKDLYYRLMVFPLELPPLRDRREDIPLLANHFLARYTVEFGRQVPGFTQETLDAMAAHDWPGNIRELENEVQRLVIQAEPNQWLEPSALSPQVRRVEGTVTKVNPQKGTLKQMIAEVERWLLTEALREHGNNKTRTAKSLGITREGLHKKLAKHGM